jgi:S-DNA-T family DNA segregation ATPase FtsK/SpoIIIE
VAALLSILIQQRPENSRFYIADFTTADSEWAEHAEEIAHRFPGEISVIGRQRETGSLFATIAREVRLRGENSPRHGSIFLVLQGMHRIKSLRENMDDEDGNNSVELLQTILRDGPEVGVHVIAWADTLDNAKRGLSSKAIGEFGLRVGAAMSTGDSMNFLDNLAASKISKSHRVIFADEDRPGQLVTFRPYAMPSLSWLGQTGQQMRARINSRNTT